MTVAVEDLAVARNRRQDAAVSVTAHDPPSVLAAIQAANRFLIQQVF